MTTPIARGPVDVLVGRNFGGTTMADTDLAAAMITRADADGLPDGHDMRSKAAAFDEAAKGFYAEPQTCDVKKFMGCWARARRAWCDYTGKPLI